MASYEKTLQGSLLESTIDNLPVAILINDRDLKVVLANKTAEEFTGKSRDLFLGLPGGEVIKCVNSIKDLRGCGYDKKCNGCKLRNSIINTFNNKSDLSKIEIQTELKNHVEKTLRISTRYLENYDYVMIAMEDITELKMIEKEKIKTKKILAKMEETATLCNAIKKPLESISGIFDILIMRTDPEDFKKKELLSEGREQIKTLGDLTQRLMQLNSLNYKEFI